VQRHPDDLTNVGFVIDDQYAPIAALTSNKESGLEFTHDNLLGERRRLLLVSMPDNSKVDAKLWEN
jgi:hypothetical protein